MRIATLPFDCEDLQRTAEAAAIAAGSPTREQEPTCFRTLANYRAATLASPKSLRTADRNPSEPAGGRTVPLRMTRKLMSRP